MRLSWSRAALNDLVELRAYIANDRPRAAAGVARRILHAVNRLEQYPRMGRSGPVEETRELIVSDTPYLVAYRIQDETIVLLRILHGARKWPDRF